MTDAVQPGWEIIDCPVCAGTEFLRLFEKAGEPIAKCLNCGLTLINPRPHYDTIKAGYDADYSGAYIRKAASKLRRSRRRVRRLERRYGLSGAWLDVGCSAGFVVKAAQEAGFEAHGVDIEAAGIGYGTDELGLHNLRRGELLEQHYPSAYFAAISAYDVIEHVPDLNAFIGELKRILAPRGVIDLGTPDIGHWRVPNALERWPEIKPSEHLYYFNRTTLRCLFEKHRLQVTRIRFNLKPGLKVSVRHA